MGFLADIYVIKKSRSRSLVNDFLNHFLPQRTESAAEYCIPEYSGNPTFVFESADELMSFLEKNENYSNRIYWKNADENSLNKHGMVFYNEDGSMIFGISRNADMSGELNTDSEDQCLIEMKEYFDTNLGYILYETPPADSYSEFVEIVNNAI